MKKIKVGILGAGRIGQVHLASMKMNPQVEVKTVADVFMSDELSAQIKTEGMIHTTKNADEIFEDKDIHAIFICTPTNTHFDFSMRAIEKSIHVFCEKPIDMELSRIVEVKDALTQSDIVYQVGFNRRFDHNFLAAKHAITTGQIGSPQMIRITSRDPSPPPIEYIHASGGLFMDMMIHDFDMLRYQTSSEVEEVYTMGGVLVDENIGKAGDIDSAVVSLRLKNGMIGYIENCRQAVYGYDQRLEVLGSEGAIEVQNDTKAQIVLSNKQSISKEKPLWFFLERYKSAYALEQQKFFESILENTQTTCGIDAGYEATRIAYAAKKSLEEKRVVRIEEIIC